VTNDTVEPLLADMLEWLAAEPRGYAEALDAWRTSCPRLPVWEEAASRGFVERAAMQGGGTCLRATQAGLAFLAGAKSRARV
jgi:hypothetical protein